MTVRGPGSREPQPVYIVTRPPKRPVPWLAVAGITIVSVAALIGILNRVPAAAPTATGGVRATPAAALTPDPQLALDAAQASLNAQQDRINAKTDECAEILDDEAAASRCEDEWAALDDQWNRLDACLADVATITDVARCEDEAGIP